MSKIDCSFWSEGENSSYGICSKKLYGGSPSFGVCLYACEQYDGPERTLELIQLTLSQRSIKQSKGLGDSIEKVTKAIGIKYCDGCKKRQEWLNKHFPYKDKEEGK